MCNNDVIIEVKIEGQQSKFVTGNLLLIYRDEIVIFKDTADMIGRCYPITKMESMGVVGRYDKEGKECQHYAEHMAEMRAKK